MALPSLDMDDSQPIGRGTVQDLNGANSMSTMQGADMRGGQNSAMMAAPGLGREQVTGQTVQESQ